MTKLANEIVEIINSRNEYMEKQAGLSSFIAKKVVKPVSRFMFGKTDLAAAKAKRYLQSKDLFDKARALHIEKIRNNNKARIAIGKAFGEHFRNAKNMSIADYIQTADRLRQKYDDIIQVESALKKKMNILNGRELGLGRIYKNLGGTSGIREAIDKANEARSYADRAIRDSGILGIGGIAGGVAGRLTAPEPTLQDLLNKYKDRYFR